MGGCRIKPRERDRRLCAAALQFPLDLVAEALELGLGHGLGISDGEVRRTATRYHAIGGYQRR